MDSIDVYYLGCARWTAPLLVAWDGLRDPERGLSRSFLRYWWSGARRGRQPWQKRWQAEWDNAPFAVRGYTRWGTRRRAVRAIRALAAA